MIVKNNKLAEINPAIIFRDIIPEKVRYAVIEKMAAWKEKNVKFTFGSDSHCKYDVENIIKYDKVLSEFGFKESDFDLPKGLKK